MRAVFVVGCAEDLGVDGGGCTSGKRLRGAVGWRRCVGPGRPRAAKWMVHVAQRAAKRRFGEQLAAHRERERRDGGAEGDLDFVGSLAACKDKTAGTAGGVWKAAVWEVPER